jgi:hypothetical protein
MENTDNRIPFDWEKYQSGEYEAVCRDDNYKPEQLTYNPKADLYKVAAWVKNACRTFTEKGEVIGSKESKYDLFLIQKKKKYQSWVNLYSDGFAKEYINEDDAKMFKPRYEDENVKCVETRLIEWEV